LRDDFSYVVARFISHPSKNSSQYVTYDPLRCATAALQELAAQARVASDDESAVHQQDALLSFFDAAFIALIIVNLGLVASTHVMQANSVSILQANLDIVMNVLYSCELLTRLIAYNSVFLYVSNNPFDFCVVIISDIFLIIDSTTSISLPGINIFRVARLLRAFKLLYRIPRIRVLLRRMFSAMEVAILPCGMLLFWIFCFALIGIQLFKNFGTVSSRLGFESFDVGYITAFSVMTFEKWLDVLDGLISQNQATAVIFFIVFVGVGKYLGLYGIAAGVLMTFSLDDGEKYSIQKIQFNQKRQEQEKIRIQDEARKAKNRRSSLMIRRSSSSAGMHSAAIERLREGISQHDVAVTPGKLVTEPDREMSSLKNVHRNSIKSLGNVEPGSSRAPAIDSLSVGNVQGLPFVRKADVAMQTSFCNAKGDVLFFFSPENSLRGLAVSIIASSAFSFAVIISVMASIVLLLSSTPYKENPITPSISRNADYVFQGIFILECLLKVLSSGFWGHLGYWKSYWNRLDFFIIFVGALDLVISEFVSDVQVLRVVRVLRMIRPLRLLSRFETLQVRWRLMHS
jgi:hypothetical protein